MTTTSASRPINSTEATFSYAAAASGKNATGSTPSKSQTNGSSKSPGQSPPSQRPVSSASSTTPIMNGNTAPATRASTSPSVPTAAADSHSKSNGEMNSAPIPSSPSIGSASTSTVPKEDDSVASISSVSEDKNTSWEKQSQASSREDKKTSSAGSRTPDVPKDVTFVPAPLPLVNVWEVKSRNQTAKKSNAPAAVPAAAKTSASPSNATVVKDNVDKLAEKKKKPIGENVDVSEKTKEGSSGVGKDVLARDPKDRKKSADAGRVNGYPGKDDAGIPKKSRKAQLEKESAAPVLPPPVTDVESWPTPEIAQDEVEKAKREKDEKDKTTSSGVRSGNWVPLPIPAPYASVFGTKSVRGSRGSRGGGRGGAGVIPSSSPNGEKHGGSAAGSGSGAGVDNERGRQNSGAGPSRGGYRNGGGKRATSTGGTVQRREQKGSPPVPAQDKRKELTSPEAGEAASESIQSAKTSSTGTQTHPEGLRRGSRADESGYVSHGDGRQFSENQERGHQNGNGQNHHRPERGPYQGFNSNRSDHRGMGDNGSSTHTPRDRGYDGGRGGRGGYRRGGYNNSQFSNGHMGHHHDRGHYGSSTPTHFNSHPANGQYPPQGSQSSARVFRGSRSGHNNQGYNNNRFPNPNMQPPPPNYMPYPVPFEAYMIAPNGMPVHVELPGMVDIIAQLNYYFSVDNLCKDMFLRKNMDSDGYVRLSVIAKFNRMKQLTQDLNILQQACLQSQEVQLATGIDDLHIRKAIGWETWILSESERDPAARCGMTSWNMDPRQRVQQNTLSGPPLEMSGSAVPFMPDTSRGRTQSGIAPGAPVFIPSGSYPNVADSPIHTTGATPLSADVPEFSPSTIPFVSGQEEDHSVPRDEFPDADIGRLVVVCKRNGGGESNNTSPVASPSKPRSNGVVNGVLTNGTTSGPSSPTRSLFGHRSSEVGWLLSGDPEHQAPTHLYVHKLYHAVLAHSLENRGASKTGEMVILYKFWVHFLLDKFNNHIYGEFKHWALADADISSRFGLESLFKFYDGLLKERDQIHESLIQDFVALTKKDARNGNELGSEKLKSILENPRLSVQNKQKIEALLDSEIRNVLKNGVEKREGQPIESYAA